MCLLSVFCLCLIPVGRSPTALARILRVSSYVFGILPWFSYLVFNRRHRKHSGSSFKAIMGWTVKGANGIDESAGHIFSCCVSATEKKSSSSSLPSELGLCIRHPCRVFVFFTEKMILNKKTGFHIFL